MSYDTEAFLLRTCVYRKILPSIIDRVVQTSANFLDEASVALRLRRRAGAHPERSEEDTTSDGSHCLDAVPVVHWVPISLSDIQRCGKQVFGTRVIRDFPKLMWNKPSSLGQKLNPGAGIITIILGSRRHHAGISTIAHLHFMQVSKVR